MYYCPIISSHLWRVHLKDNRKTWVDDYKFDIHQFWYIIRHTQKKSNTSSMMSA